MNRAVVAIDLSPSDDRMLSYLEEQRKFMGIHKFHFVHVLPEKLTSYPLTTGLWEPWSSDTMDEILGELKKRVSAILRVDKKDMEFHLTKGDPLSELLDFSRDLSADLVVIGQKSGVKKHGVLAKNFIRNVECYGLVIPENRPDKLSHILVPVDFSPHSARALKEAVKLRKASDSKVKITALHVYELPALGYYKLSMTEKKFSNTIKTNIEDSLKKFIQSQVPKAAGEISRKAISRGVPGIASYISEYALAIDADFIIMGAKGHSKIKLLLMGSVTEGILSSDSVLPTLITR
jgi:nucleotide-binding universal stress UspA family protein